MNGVLYVVMTVNERMILLVEDDPDHEALTIRALKKANIANNIRVAHDGEEAIHMLFGGGESTLPYLPQVVLLDLKLPKIDGLEVLRRIQIGRASCRERVSKQV